MISFFAIAHLASTNAQAWTQQEIDRLRAELPTLSEPLILYHWANSERSLRWIKQGFVDAGEVAFLNKPTGDRQVYGPGIYFSVNPTDTESYGQMVTITRLPAGTRIYDAEVARRILGRELNANEQAALGAEVGFARKVSQSWWTTHNGEQMTDISSGLSVRPNLKTVGARSILEKNGLTKNDVPVTYLQNAITELKNADPKKFGYLDSFLTLARYQDGVSFLRSIQVNPMNPWAEFEGENFENFRATREEIYQKVHAAWTFKKDHNDEGNFARTKRNPLGISENGKFLQSGKTQAEWVDAQVKIYQEIRAKVGGQDKAGFDRGPIAASSEESSLVVKKGKAPKGAMLITPSQMEAISSNPYLFVKSVKDPTTGNYKVIYEYSDVRSWMKFKDKIPKELIDHLEKLNFSKMDKSSPAFRLHNEKFLEALVRDTFNRYYGKSINEAPSLMRELISIHPGSDFNGRSTRLYIEAAEIESNKLPGYHFLSDLDTFTSSNQYQEIMEKSSLEIAHLQSRALNEVLRANREGRVPNLFGINQWGEDLFATFKDSFHAVGMQPNWFTNSEQELVRTRKWNTLLKSSGDVTFDLNERDSWIRAFSLHIKGANPPFTDFQRQIVRKMPDRIGEGLIFSTAEIAKSFEVGGVSLRFPIQEAIAKSVHYPLQTRIDAVKLLGRFKKLEPMLKNDPALLTFVIKQAPKEITVSFIRENAAKIASAVKKPAEDFTSFFKHVQTLDPEAAFELEFARLEITSNDVGNAIRASEQAKLLDELTDAMNNLYKRSDVKKKQRISGLFDKMLTDRCFQRDSNCVMFIDQINEVLPEIRGPVVYRRVMAEGFNNQLFRSPDQMKSQPVNQNKGNSSTASGRGDLYDLYEEPSFMRRVNSAKRIDQLMMMLPPDVAKQQEVQRLSRMASLYTQEKVFSLQSKTISETTDERLAATMKTERAAYIRMLEGRVKACTIESRCSDLAIVESRHAFEQLMTMDPLNSSLLNWLKENPGSDSIDVLPILKSIAKSKKLPPGITRELIVKHLASIASLHRSNKGQFSTSQRLFQLAQQLDVEIPFIEAISGLRNFEIPEIVAQRYMKTKDPMSAKAIELVQNFQIPRNITEDIYLDLVKRGDMQWDHLIKIFPEHKAPPLDKIAKVLRALPEGSPIRQKVIEDALQSEVYLLSASDGFVYTYKFKSELKTHAKEFLALARPSFETWSAMLAKADSMSAFALSEILDTILDIDPSIKDRLLQRTKEGADVRHWARALAGSITNRKRAAGILEQLISQDSSGQLREVLAKEFGDDNAAGIVLKKMGDAGIDLILERNPRASAFVATTPAAMKKLIEAAANAEGIEPKDIPEQLGAICIKSGVPMKRCNLTDLAEFYKYDMTTQLFELWDYAVAMREFDFLAKRANADLPILSGRRGQAGFSARTLSLLLEHIDKNPNSKLNSYYLRNLIETGSQQGRILLSPTQSWKLSRLQLSGASSLEAKDFPLVLTGAIVNQSTVLPGSVKKALRGCQTFFQKLKRRLN